MKKFYKIEEELIISDKKLNLPELNVEKEFNEKHTPNVNVTDDSIEVTINHGMSDEHYITHIIYEYNGGYQVVELTVFDEPTATFKNMGAGVIYEHCNLHGIYSQNI